MKQVPVNCGLKKSVSNVVSIVNENGSEECFIEMQQTSQTTQNAVEVAGNTYKYTMFLAPFLGFVCLIAFLFAIYKSIKKKENRGKWIMISIILFLLVVLFIVLLTIQHYAGILAPWIYA